MVPAIGGDFVKAVHYATLNTDDLLFILFL